MKEARIKKANRIRVISCCYYLNLKSVDNSVLSVCVDVCSQSPNLVHVDTLYISLPLYSFVLYYHEIPSFDLLSMAVANSVYTEFTVLTCFMRWWML